MLSDGTWTYTWRHGRQLASMTKGSTTWTFTYNSDGLRTKRSNGTDTYSYHYVDGLLTRMRTANHIAFITHDAMGRPMTINYDDVTYLYVTNPQGDVIAIVKTDGTTVVEYSYDAWGKVLSITGSKATTLGKFNPLRYRGYVYDQQTGLYYLQSRYYDPELGRFISADAFVSTGQGLLGSNMFAYCGNNPVNRVDPSGHVFVDIVNRIREDIEKACRFITATAEAIRLYFSPKALAYNTDNFTTYAGESDMSVIARMLYGEDHRSAEEHMWVLENRRIAGGYGGSDFRTLILAKNQFFAMSGTRALNPASCFGGAGEKPGWMTCVITAYQYTIYGMAAFTRPTGFDFTYTHAYSKDFESSHPGGRHRGDTWFYNN